MRDDVHVLTLSATPIPRTLQLALTGVRELSLITTPPVDRLAVRTYISPFDPVILKEALRRERFRGGQTYYVAPRISDLDDIAEFLRETVPDLVFARATGQMTPTELEDVMTRILRGQVRHPALDRDRRVGPRRAERQHADRASLRYVRPCPALSAARPRRPLEDARLRLHHDAARSEADRRRREATQGFAVARHARRRVLARLARSRHPRRRQSAGRRAVRPHPRSRLRTLPVDAGGGGRGDEGWRLGSRRQVESGNPARHRRS